MGWAKYYEDNMSIYVERMAVADISLSNHVKIYYYPQPEKHDNESDKTVQRKLQNGRRGLELRFGIDLDRKMIRLLQMNGWWWSKTNNCWCNLNNKANRRYIQNTFGKFNPQIKTVVYAA